MGGKYRLELLIDRTKVGGGELRDFPIRVELHDVDLRHVSQGGKVADRDGHDIAFHDAAGAKRLAHEQVTYDPVNGILEAWVRVPFLSDHEDTRLLLCCGGADCPPGSVQVWDGEYRLVIHWPEDAEPRDVTRYNHQITLEPDEPHVALARVPHSTTLDVNDALTIEAWVHDFDGRAEAMQVVAAAWRQCEAFDAFEAYDAGMTDGMDTTGFFGAVFDGRHVYFVPQHDKMDRHGKALRFDTHGSFHDAASWDAFDAGAIDGMVTKGYYGAVHAGRFIYFCPRREPAGFHSRVLRYDRHAAFKGPRSWEAYDVGLGRSCQSAAYDGRYIYFCPGQEARPATAGEKTADDSPKVTGMSGDQLLMSSGIILRHDTRGRFKDPSSWVTYDAANTDGLDTRDFDGAVFDGRFVYFMPLTYAAVLRYDTHGEFTSAKSWSAFDACPLGMRRLVGGVFDGRHVYFVPYGRCPVAVRYDTGRDFQDSAGWQAFELNAIPGLPAIGYDGGFFDGRYVYYIPYWNEADLFHGVALRYDTQGCFTEPSSWKFHDAGQTDKLKTTGFNGGATDGRYQYFAPWNDGTAYPDRIVGNGRVLRYDTVGESGTFALKYCDYGSNGGLCAALPGAAFIVNTDRGPVSIAAHRPPTAGVHYLAGVYEGARIRLMLDGDIFEQPAHGGRLVRSGVDLAIGRFLDGLGQFPGRIREVRISQCARSNAWLKTTAANLRCPAEFCRLLPADPGSGEAR